VVESSALLKRRSPKGYRGFESLPHRVFQSQQKMRTRIAVKIYRENRLTDRGFRVTSNYKNTTRRIGRGEMAKKIVNIRLRPDQEERINAIVERSAILDTSKFVRIAVDWLLRSDIGEVIKEIVHDEEHFPDYRIPKKSSGRKKRKRSR
jgi:hypothetical protein